VVWEKLTALEEQNGLLNRAAHFTSVTAA